MKFKRDSLKIDTTSGESKNSQDKKKIVISKRNIYKQNKVESIDNFNMYYNSLSSFDGGNSMIQAKKRRKSDIIQREKYSGSSKFNILSLKDIKYPSYFEEHALFYKKIYSSNRSRSLKAIITNRRKFVKLRRTLSDFHELVRTKLNISIELFTGRNKFNEIKPKINKNTMSSENSSDEEHSSVSNYTTEEEFESLGMIRFFSLPILPSEKECLEINFDDDLKQIHKVNYTKTTIKDFFLLRAVSHGAYGKVCLARK